MKQTLGSIYIWLYTSVLFLSILFLVLILWPLTAPFDKHRQVCNRIMLTLGAYIVKLNPGWKMDIRGREHLKRISNRGAILVSNHQSFMDMPLQCNIGLNFKWVARTELFKIPVMGWFMSLTKTVSINRDKSSITGLSKQVIPLLNDGIDVLIFPEGTRSRDNNIKPFKKGAFMVAQEAGANVIPVVLDGAYQTLPPKSWKYRLNASLKLTILEPIDSNAFTDISALIVHTQNVMIEALEQMRKN